MESTNRFEVGKGAYGYLGLNLCVCEGKTLHAANGADNRMLRSISMRIENKCVIIAMLV